MARTILGISAFYHDSAAALVRDGGFELVLADNSYGRLELGAQLAFHDDTTHVRATTQLDDGPQVRVDFTSA